MKTQLILLESHDDLISIRDRMSWAKTPRILLIWPKSERIPLRPIDLKVLQRHAVSLGAQLGLVTRHHDIRRGAQALGIPVFGSTGEAQRNPWPERDLMGKREWRKPRRDLREIRKQVRVEEGAWRWHPLVRVLSFLLGVLAVLAVASLFIPHAEVTLTPQTQVQSVTLPVRADPSVNEVLITGNIPARQVGVTVEASREALATGEMQVPRTRAEGVVTFRNLTEGNLQIPAGTVLTSTGLPGIRFATQEDADLPEGLKATVDVPVQAEQAGAAGNVEAGTILAIEGNLGLQTAVTNEQPTTGGTDRTERAATEKDRAKLREGLLAELQSQALEQIHAQLSVGDVLFPDTLDIAQIVDEIYDPPSGQPGQKVSLTLRAEFMAFYASNDDLTELASTVLNASLPSGFVAVDAPLSFEPLSSLVSNDAGVTRWTVLATRNIEQRLNLAQVAPLVQGRDPAAARAQLEDNLSLASPPQITMSPNWWPWLPLIPFNISVELP